MNSYYHWEDSLTAVDSLIRSGKLSVVSGDILSEFEEGAADLFGSRYGVATCNGTAAIHSALFACGVGHDDEVMVPAYGFHGMVTPILQLGATPIFCDVDAQTLAIKPEDIEKRLTVQSKVILVLHPWGNIADLDAIRVLAQSHGLYILSDASHAHGAKWRGHPLGRFSDIVCASFGKGKLISGGELGAATCDKVELRDKMLLYGHVNRVPQALITGAYKHIENAIGIKYRPHPVALTLALKQLESFSERLMRLNENVRQLEAAAREVGFFTQQEDPRAQRSYWKVIVRGSRSSIVHLRACFRRAGLPFEDNHYSTILHQSTIVTDYYGLGGGSYPVSESVNGTLLQIDAISVYEQHALDAYLLAFAKIGRDI